MEDRIDLTAELLLAQRVADDRYEEIKALRAERDELQARVDAAVAVTMRRYLPDGPAFAALAEDIAEIHRELTRGEKGEE